ncbi:hypothetical protein JKP88DRAFT_272531 [Tribonema minus]|uniref:BAR domain-containing protein n=1 Tax=Tribonema minus TaxID=303371 RepID=A0A835Z3B5_9STRA|nr:hypothetical protein JKP88DRAFT_272531 [Tribonema minus]
MITNAEHFRAKLKESAGLASKLAHNFMRMSQGDVGEGEPEEAWMTTAKRQSEVLKTTTADSALVVEQVLYIDMDQFLLSDLKAQLESYSDINKLVKERYELKVELQHYSDKVQELNFNPKATEEKKVRNAEKYATANNKLREQTDALMRRFAEAELRRRRVLEEDLPRLMDLHRSTYEAMAANALKAAQGITLAPA